MANRKDNSLLPGEYQGREQAFIKHCLLKAYLKKLFYIVGMGGRATELCYVDCFAGPWRDETEELETTSIAISLHILAECQQELTRQGKAVRFRALYVEKDTDAFARLERYIKERRPPGVEACAINGNFVDHRQSILEWCGDRSFVFFFIDPTAWKPVSVHVLKPLLQRPFSEFLINFMYDFLNRAVSMRDQQTAIAELLGQESDVGDMHGEEREKHLLDIYRQNVKSLMPKRARARSAYVRVLDRTKERLKYHLVYLTSHPRGIIEFMEISEDLDSVQKRVRAATKYGDRIEKSGQNELFMPEQLPVVDGAKTSIREVESFWLRYLASQPKRVGPDQFAEILEETDLFPGDLQRALGNLMAAKRVINLDAVGKRRKKFLHIDKNERLQLTEEGK